MKIRILNAMRISVLLSLLCLLYACGGGSDTDSESSSTNAPAVDNATNDVATDPVADADETAIDDLLDVPADTPVASANAAPTISGSPANTAVVGEPFNFAPTADDADGDSLTFAIENAPQWIDFDTATGVLSGIPNSDSIGLVNVVVISVTDGELSATLDFELAVVSASVEPPSPIEPPAPQDPSDPVEPEPTEPDASRSSISLSITPPSFNDDGSPLIDLAGVRVLYGVESGSYSGQIETSSSQPAEIVIPDLLAGTYFISAVAFTEAGVESLFADEIVVEAP